MVPLDSGPPAAFAYGDQTCAASTIVATGDVAYQGGDRNGWVTKWGIAGSQPGFQWEFPLGGNSFYNFSDAAIASDASFLVTESGDHASAFWNVADDHQRAWRAGALDWIAADGRTAWTVPALATTPPVIGQSGLVYVGALLAAGTPAAALDNPGLIRAFDHTGQQVWTAPTTGLPQDLFVGDDGNLYALVGGTQEGQILALDQQTGVLKLTIAHVAAPWEMVLRNHVVYVAGDSGVAAIPLPAGFARHYDGLSPWPIRQHDNQRTSNTLGGVVADTTPPVVTCASPDPVWHANDISLACSATDDESGLANASDASFSLSTNVPVGVETASAFTGPRTVCDVSSNCATVGPFGGNKIDKKPPTVTIASPSASVWTVSIATG
jgi:hypothetical protein